MKNSDKIVEIIINWTRWTVGIAWEYTSTKYEVFDDPLWRLEISIQLPVIAFSFLFQSKEFN
jgi:hypothetical protein